MLYYYTAKLQKILETCNLLQDYMSIQSRQTSMDFAYS